MSFAIYSTRGNKDDDKFDLLTKIIYKAQEGIYCRFISVIAIILYVQLIVEPFTEIRINQPFNMSFKETHK